jgi:hypothetical protein
MAFENKLLRKTCWPKRDREIGEGRGLNNEKLHNPYASPNTMWVTRSRRGHVRRTVKEQVHTGLWLGKSERKRPLGRCGLF